MLSAGSRSEGLSDKLILTPVAIISNRKHGKVHPWGGMAAVSCIGNCDILKIKWDRSYMDRVTDIALDGMHTHNRLSVI
jgi:hypothetical protein